MRCTGSGSPTVILEADDDDPGASYDFAQSAVSAVTRTCVYDRANLGRSDPDPGPRELAELVGDFENLIEAADIPGPYVLVGTSGGGTVVLSLLVAIAAVAFGWRHRRSLGSSSVRDRVSGVPPNHMPMRLLSASPSTDAVGSYIQRTISALDGSVNLG